MAGGFKVKAAAVVLPTEDGSERYLYRSGAILPTRGFTVEGLKHAASLGLIEKAELPKSDDEQSNGAGESKPEGEPSEKWTKDQLEAYAAEKQVDIASAKNKADLVAAIAAAAKPE